MFRTLFRYLRLAMTISLLILIVMFLIGRLRGATAEQKQALDLLADKPSFKQEDNLAPYLWLLEYEVPPEKIKEIYAEDTRRFTSLISSNKISGFKTQADGRYKKIDYLSDELSAYCCKESEKHFLANIERHQQKLRPLLQKAQNAISRAERITDFRVHYSSMKMHIEAPLPAFNTGRQLLRVHFADLFINGNRQLALDKVCRDISGWRSIGANSDSLIGSMVGHAYVRQDLSLLADMLGRMNPDDELPESCELAMRPVDYRENMICNAMQGEYGMQENLDFTPANLDEKNGATGRFVAKTLIKIVHDKEGSLSKVAPVYAKSCTVAAVEVAKRNENLVMDIDSSGAHLCGTIDWVSNWAGCFLIDVGTPDLQKYPGRRLDQSAQITAMQIYHWLREKQVPRGELEKTFAMRPDSLGAFADRITLDINTGVIRVELLSPASDGEKTWSLPIPHYPENRG